MIEPKYGIGPLDNLQAAEIASRLLTSDWEECEAFSGTHPGELLKASASQGDIAYAVYRLKDNEPMAVFGAYPVTKTSFGVWMLVTDAFDLPAGTFTRRHMLRILKVLGSMCTATAEKATCLAWEGNEPHQRWLYAAGWRPTGKKVTTEHSPIPFKELSINVCSPAIGVERADEQRNPQ